MEFKAEEPVHGGFTSFCIFRKHLMLLNPAVASRLDGSAVTNFETRGIHKANPRADQSSAADRHTEAKGHWASIRQIRASLRFANSDS
jgi:hypothetical protein